MQTAFPQLLRDELRLLDSYTFDFDSAHLTSYETWHVHGTHLGVADTPVLARVPVSSGALRLEQEFAIVRHMQKLDPTAAHFIRAYEFFHLKNNGAVVSIFEYIGENVLPEFSTAMASAHAMDNSLQVCVSSSSPLQAPSRIITLCEFLGFAIGACECLEVLHSSHNIVHGEIRDDAFVYNPDIGTVKITQFGCSTTRSVQNSLANGTIQDMFENSALSSKYVYLSPEQTGRASTVIDHRTDIYSLGVVFFSLLTSRLPYYGSAMDIIHHILHSPLPSIEPLRPDIPSVIDRIIHKMTSKQASMRYLSATGLKHDLIRVHNLVKDCSSDEIDDFEIGKNDVSSIFMTPTEIIGRNIERDFIVNVVRKFAKRKSLHSGGIRRGSKHATNVSSSGIPGAGTVSDVWSYASSNPVKHDSRDSDAESSVSNATVSGVMSSPKGTAASAYTSSVTRTSHRPRTEVIVIRGHPGIGKTSLVTAVQAPVRKYGFYTRVSVREVARCPFEPLTQALSALLKQVLSERSDVLDQFYTNFRAKIGAQWPSLKKFLSVLPELQTLINLQASNPMMNHSTTDLLGVVTEDDNASLSSNSVSVDQDVWNDGMSQSSRSSSLRRRAFVPGGEQTQLLGAAELLKNSSGNKMLFASFLLSLFRVISEMFVITIVFGDMQVVDEETLELIMNIIHSKVEAVLIFTVRDGTPLKPAFQDFLDSDYSKLTSMTLKPLNRPAVELYVSQTLHREPSDISDLTTFLYENIKGNPFYLGEFLHMLYKSKVIKFNIREGRWVYGDIAKVQEVYLSFISNSEIDQSFILRRLREFPKRTKNFLIWAAFLGSPFSFRLVQLFMSLPEGLSSSDSNEGFTDNVTLIEADDKAISSLQTLLQAGVIMQAESADDFKFVHDRYSRAALALVRPENVATMNLIIAQTLMKAENHDAFHVCEHLLFALPLLLDKEYRQQYRREFVNAGDVAMESGSFTKSAEFYSAAIKLLQSDPWDCTSPDVDYNETFNLHLSLARVRYWQGKPAECLNIVDSLRTFAKNKLHLIACFRLIIAVDYMRGSYVNSCNLVSTMIRELEAVDFYHYDDSDYTHKFFQLHDQIDAMDDAQIMSRFVCDDEEKRALRTLFTEMGMMMYMGDPDKFYPFVIANMEAQFNHGACESSCTAYVLFAFVAVAKYQLYSFADRLRQIALKMITRSTNSELIGRATSIYISLLDHLFADGRDVVPLLEYATSHALTAGDRTGLLQLQAMNLRIEFVGLLGLNNVVSKCQKILDDTDPVYDECEAIVSIRSVCQAGKALIGNTKATCAADLLSDDKHDAEAYRKRLLSRKFTVSTAILNEFYILALFLFGYYREAYDLAAQHIWPQGWSIHHCSVATLYSRFFLCLSISKLAREPNVTAREREYMLARIRDEQQAIRRWSSDTSIHGFYGASIIDIDLANFDGQFEKGMKIYEDVSTKCRQTESHFLLAFSHFRAGEMCLLRGHKTLGNHMIRQGITIAREWGGIAFIERISKVYPDAAKAPVEIMYKSVGVQTVAASASPGPSSVAAASVQVGEDPELLERRSSGIPEFDVVGEPQLSRGGMRVAGRRASVKTLAEARQNAMPAERGTSTWQDDKENSAQEDEGNMTLDILDLTSIIRSGQIISSEINVDTLLIKMIEIFISTTRAEISAVVMREDGHFRVAAIGTLNEIKSFRSPQMSLESLEDTIFTAAVMYSLNASETVFLSNSHDDEQFAGAGATWMQKYPDGRSVLVHPVRHKNIVVGALYLEGAAHSFNTRHIEVIALLSQQMGISITNAMLFKNIRKATMANAAMIESQNAALKAARESESRFVATLETMPCIIWTADPVPPSEDNKDAIPVVEYLNNYWYKFCGANAPGPAQNAYLTQFHPDDREKFVAALRNTSSGEYEKIEVRIMHADGNYRWHVCRGTPLHNDEHVVTKWIGALIDIDDQRQAQENAMKAMHLKEEASRMKSEFLANMSHEIRTPIAGVIGMSDLLLTTELQQSQREFADNIRLCADALLSVITDVLDFSKIEVGKLELSNVAFDVVQVLKDTLNILSFPVSKKGLRLNDDIQFSRRPMPLVMGDPGRFRQIAMNLLTNAVKFTEGGHITLSARCGYETEDAIEVKVFISDTGIGISQSVLSKLFQPFQQGDNSTARQFGGTGLGLSISKNLVELMGGSIGLESDYGKGTIAHFVVPFLKAPPGSMPVSTNLSDGSSNAFVPSWEPGDSSYLGGMIVAASGTTSATTGTLVSATTMPLGSHSASPEVTSNPQSERLLQLMAAPTSMESKLRTSGAIMRPPPHHITRTSSSGTSVSSMQSASSELTTSTSNPEECAAETSVAPLMILVVEDNLINQQIALNLLKRLKYTAEAVTNGLEALDALDARLSAGRPFDLVLMDCQMPLMDGYEATRRLRKHKSPCISEVTVIAMTANAVIGDREKCIEAGMSDYLAKPVKFKVLEMMIDKWSRKRTPG
ncbi:uncharacterized protein V1518DRAFT_423605 [Limtongia smithiae]|uniref:uncharacterized protein n=1 Tax=Limtongia smithiae TaxID=1125753 RepID=UPI0034CD8309